MLNFVENNNGRKIPNKDPKAIKNMERAYFCCHQEAQAAAQVYIAKEEGKKAVLEMKKPAAKIWNVQQTLPICTPNSLHIALKIHSDNIYVYINYQQQITYKNKLQKEHKLIPIGT